VDHEPLDCLVCNPKPKAPRKSSKSLTGVAAAATSSLVEASKNTVANTFSMLKNSFNYFSKSKTPTGTMDSNSPKLETKEAEPSSTNTSAPHLLDISKWQQSGEFTFFKCLEIVLEDSEASGKFKTQHRILAISKEYVIVLEPSEKQDDSQSELAQLIYKDPIRNLSKITSKNPKKLSQPTDDNSSGPLYVIFYWNKKSEADQNDPDYTRRTFLVTDARSCIEMVKRYFENSLGV
jgi:hypothetical protein